MITNLRMTYPYPELIPNLQLPLSVDAYQQSVVQFYNPYHLVIKPETTNQSPPVLDHPWWDSIPYYTYALCPFCKQPCRERINTASLFGWHSPWDLTQRIYEVSKHLHEYEYPAWCPHYGGVHVFLNLHGQPPPYDSFSTEGEVPYITPWLVPDDVPSRVILWGMPICTIVGDAFVPTYTVFTLTYFSHDFSGICRRHFDQDYALYGHGREYYPCYVAGPHEPPPAGKPSLFDLDAWCSDGVLGWMDGTHVHPSIHIGKGTHLPRYYHDIQGYREGHSYRGERKRRIQS